MAVSKNLNCQNSGLDFASIIELWLKVYQKAGTEYEDLLFEVLVH